MQFWKALFQNPILIKHNQRYQEINRIHNFLQNLILILPVKLIRKIIKLIMKIRETLINHQGSSIIIKLKRAKALLVSIIHKRALESNNYLNQKENRIFPITINLTPYIHPQFINKKDQILASNLPIQINPKIHLY